MPSSFDWKQDTYLSIKNLIFAIVVKGTLISVIFVYHLHHLDSNGGQPGLGTASKPFGHFHFHSQTKGRGVSRDWHLNHKVHLTSRHGGVFKSYQNWKGSFESPEFWNRFGAHVWLNEVPDVRPLEAAAGDVEYFVRKRFFRRSILGKCISHHLGSSEPFSEFLLKGDQNYRFMFGMSPRVENC